MAILEVLPGIEVVICIDGQPLKEYPADEEKLKANETTATERLAALTVSNFVESTDDKEFAVGVRIKEHYAFTSPKIGFQTVVDGTHIQTLIIGPDLRDLFQNDKIHWLEGIYKGSDGNKGYVRPMKFVNIKTKDERPTKEIFDKESSVYRNIGEITVSVFKYSAGQVIASDIRPNIKIGKADYDQIIHEKSLKGTGKSHGTISSGVKEVGVQSFWNSVPAKNPMAVFRFHYRSLKSLQDMHIPGVPSRTPSPQPLLLQSSNIIDLDGLEEDSKVKLQEFLQEIIPRGMDPTTFLEVKQEKEEGSGDRPRKRRKFREKTMVDLTDESWENAIVLDD